jgi:L-lactate dehydrogenase complex protein LldE
MPGETIQLMPTCLVDRMAPEVGRATVRVLEDAGFSIDVPDGLTCCGQPAYNVGLSSDAREMAAHTLSVLDSTEGTIVLPSGSCAAMIAVHYPEIFQGASESDAALRVADRTKELSQFLIEEAPADLTKRVCGECTVTVHRSCHGLRTLGLGDNVEQLVANVEGVTLVPLDGAEECCGFGGLFSIEMPEVSAAIMDTKLDRVEASGAGILVAGDVSCLMHLEGGLRRRNSSIAVRHFVELLGGNDAT